jgi:small subunit ribosomal protein S16
MLMIRLQRRGTHKKPFYKIVINEKTKTPRSNVLEIFGSYDPFTKELVVKEDRLSHWMSVGAQCSATLNNLLITKKIIKGEKVRTWIPKKKPLTEEEKKQLADAKKAEIKRIEEKNKAKAEAAKLAAAV